MRKVFLGLIVAGAAFGTSAFTSAAPTKAHDANVYYVLNTAGTYVRTATVPTGDFCQEDQDNKCWMAYATDQGVSFQTDQLPEAPITEQSESNGIYLPQ